MSLGDFLRKQLIDVIQWTEESDGVLATRYPMRDMEIQYGARLTVRESQMAVFVNEGKVADAFGPGLYTLETKTLPLLTNLQHWYTGFESPFKSDVYFFATRIQTDQRWGTQQPMTVRDKVVGGLANSVSLFSATGWLAAAGWAQLLNSSPNYGTDSGAFGQRLGAAAIRSTSQGIFTNSLFAPLFHEDSRYYVMGAGHPFLKRVVYAGTRAIITRTDSGHSTPNFALFAGNAAGSALTIPYYPAQNTTFGEVAETFGGSIGGSALGFVVDEFIVDALIDLHIKKKQQQP